MKDTKMDNENTSTVADNAAQMDIKLSKVDAKRLTEVKAQNDKKEPFYSLAKPMTKLVTHGLVAASTDPQYEHPDNASKADDAKLLPYGVTEKGNQLLGRAAEVLAAPAVQRAPVDPSEFVMQDDVTLPASAPVGRASIYPFDKLKLNAGFFVPNTAARPDAYKSMSSSVSSKNKTGAAQEGENKRKYEIAKGSHNGVDGAWIKRVV